MDKYVFCSRFVHIQSRSLNRVNGGSAQPESEAGWCIEPRRFNLVRGGNVPMQANGKSQKQRGTLLYTNEHTTQPMRRSPPCNARLPLANVHDLNP